MLKKIREESHFCSDCANSKNQFERHCHFLCLGDGLAGHLQQHYVTGEETPEAAGPWQKLSSPPLSPG